MSYEYWREYPERDPQAVVWYPCTYSPLEPGEIWAGGCDERSPKSIGFYVHVPLCKGVCRFCPFNKYPWSASRAEQFVAALKREIGLVTERSYFERATVAAGYFGGGTPTALSTEQLLDLIDCCRTHFRIEPGAEMTVEATPDTLDRDQLKALRGAGVNRLSIGVQSFNERVLRALGRACPTQRSLEAIDLARNAGMEVVTIDLMYRAPGQTLSDWEADLRLAGRLGLDHLTTFSLFVDPGTPMYEGDAMSGSAGQPDEETELAMYRMALDILGAEGYSLYTLYDFARPGAECVHHAINWRAPQGDYAGLGPGAFSFIRDGSASHIYCNESSLDRYADAIAAGRQPVAMGKRLSLEEEMSRYVALGVNFLRVPRDPFRRQFGLDLERVYAKELDRLICWGLVELGTQEMVLTDKGRIYLANVSKEFFTGENRGKPHVVGMELQKGEGLSLMAVRSNAG